MQLTGIVQHFVQQNDPSSNLGDGDPIKFLRWSSVSNSRYQSISRQLKDVKMKNCLLATIVLYIAIACAKREKTPLKFRASYNNESDYDTIQLTLKNVSDSVYYYSIGVQGLTKKGWEGLVADIRFLGRNDMLGLQAIKGKAVIVQYVSRKYIYFIYHQKHLKNIRFSVMYFKKADLDSEYESIKLPPM